jgi:hypothetical protein
MDKCRDSPVEIAIAASHTVSCSRLRSLWPLTGTLAVLLEIAWNGVVVFLYSVRGRVGNVKLERYTWPLDESGADARTRKRSRPSRSDFSVSAGLSSGCLWQFRKKNYTYGIMPKWLRQQISSPAGVDACARDIPTVSSYHSFCCPFYF